MSRNRKKSHPKETVAERVKLLKQKTQKTGGRIKVFILDKLLARLPVLLAQIKA